MSKDNSFPLRALEMPSLSGKCNRIFDESISPYDRIRTMSDTEFEDLTAAWVLKVKNYANVCTVGGSKDAGRDIVAYYASPTDKIDIYQCKHCNKPLSPAIYCVEFGKLCCYTWKGTYRVPEKYYIVGSNGIGDSLRTLIEHPERINAYLTSNWDKYCRKKNKITSDGVKLDDDLKEYIQSFDFTIVDEVSPQTLIKEMESSKLYKYFFGGGLKTRPFVPKPANEMGENELAFPYVQQLFHVYSESIERPVKRKEDITDEQYVKHLQAQRHCYYSAQSLARFARDELIDNDFYRQIETEVQYAIQYPSYQKYPSRFDRVEKVLSVARDLNIINPILQPNSLDKCGICHELVNEGELMWYE